MIRCIKAFSFWFLVPTMVLLPLLTGGVQAAEGLSELVALALANNPEIKAAEERLGMTEEKAKQVGTLDDPMLMLKIQNGLLNNPLAFDRDTTTAKVIGITQALPFYGKRDLRRQGAGFDVLADRLRIEESRLSLQRMVKETWYRISAVDRSLEALEKTIGALNDLLRFSETMYGVGKGLQQDVLKAQLERSKMEEMRLNLEQQRRSLDRDPQYLGVSTGADSPSGNTCGSHCAPATDARGPRGVGRCASPLAQGAGSAD